MLSLAYSLRCCMRTMTERKFKRKFNLTVRQAREVTQRDGPLGGAGTAGSELGQDHQSVVGLVQIPAHGLHSG